MLRKFKISGLDCLCCAPAGSKGKIAYILYPMDTLLEWIEPAAKKYGTSIAVITGMDWQNVMSPWPAKGVPKGTPDFKGEAADFLSLLQTKVIPGIESAMTIDAAPRRTLVGVSMSGLFALWQWMLCDTFTDIASLSGSFWYEGFLDWIKTCPIPHRPGKAFFLLGSQEARYGVKAFSTVAVNTAEIITVLEYNGIKTEFQSVPGNHYSEPIPRLDKAFTALFGHTSSRPSESHP